MITEIQIFAFTILCACIFPIVFWAIYSTFHCPKGGWHEDDLVDSNAAFFGRHGSTFEKYKCKKCGRIVDWGDNW